MPDRDPVDFLTRVPLLDGINEADLSELAQVMRRRIPERPVRGNGVRPELQPVAVEQ